MTAATDVPFDAPAPARDRGRPRFSGSVRRPYLPATDELERLYAAGFSDLIAFDDETDTGEGFDGLVGSRTRLLSRGIASAAGTISFVVADTPLTGGEHRRLLQLGVTTVGCEDEVQVLRRSAMEVGRAASYLPPARPLPPLLVTFNGSFFDIPLTLDRAVANGIDPLSDLWFSTAAAGRRGVTGYRPLVTDHPPMEGHAGGYELRWAGCDHVDLLQAYRDETGSSVRLKQLSARELGEEPASVDYTRMAELTTAELAAYTASDVAVTRELAFRHLDAVLARVPHTR